MYTQSVLKRRCFSLIAGGFALWLSANAMAAAASNGVSANGLSFNGMALNGMALNGMALNGMALNGMALNGMALNGMALNGMALNGIPFNGLALNGMALNGLALNGMALNGLTFNGIAVNALHSRTSQAAPDHVGTLVKSASGRELLKYAVDCALNEGDRLLVQRDGLTHTFSGSMGLASEWLDGPLSSPGQRWVTACLLARVNLFGATVPISMRGTHPALRTSPDEEAAYRTEEGAFYGNLFTHEPMSSSCVGNHNQSSAVSPDLTKRVCATGVNDGKTACGFIAAGQCQQVCSTQADGPGRGYSNCRSGAGRSGKTAEVITVFLRSGE